MAGTKIGWFTAAAGLAAALVLGNLPALEPKLQERRAEAANAVPLGRLELSDDNLPDTLGRLPLELRMVKAGWDHRILSVDLALRPDRPASSGVWKDVPELIRFSFGTSGNVRQLLLRIYREGEGRRTLLFYGDMRKEDWPASEALSLRAPEPSGYGAFLRRTGLAATAAGERWIQNFAI